MQRCRNALRCCNYEDLFSFVPKREPEKGRVERLGGSKAMKAPVGLLSRQPGLRSKCRVFSAARAGTNQGLLAPNNPIYVCYTEKFGRFTHSREDLCPNFPASLICCFAADVMLL